MKNSLYTEDFTIFFIITPIFVSAQIQPIYVHTRQTNDTSPNTKILIHSIEIKNHYCPIKLF